MTAVLSPPKTTQTPCELQVALSDQLFLNVVAGIAQLV